MLFLWHFIKKEVIILSTTILLKGDEMQKTSKLQNIFFISNGMIHMAYQAYHFHTVISHYSDSDILSDEFISTVDQVEEYVPENLPIVLEISGCEFDENEKRCIERAIRKYYFNRLQEVKDELKNYCIRMVYFLLSLIVSSALLFMTNDQTNNLLLQYAFLPFWFFGYRIMIFLFVDLIPQIRRVLKEKQFFAMKVIFTANHPINEVPIEKRDAYIKEIEKNLSDTNTESYLNNSSSVTLRINGIEDVVRDSSIAGYEMVSDEFANCLEKIDGSISDIVLISDSVEGKEKIQRAIQNYFLFQVEQKKNRKKGSQRKIMWFFFALILSSILLMVFHNSVNVAVNELITMLFWFFGDFLIEYVLLEYREAAKDLKESQKSLDIRLSFENE